MNDFQKQLKPVPDTSADEIKSNYIRLVKANHPDLFPEHQRKIQNIILMEINEAYLYISGERSAQAMKTGPGKTSGCKNNPHLDKSFHLEKHANPDYAYYKTAFDLYQKGQFIFNNSRFSIKNIKRAYDMDLGKIKETALEALELYLQAYRYFYRVTMDYPDSIWVADCADKMHYIEILNIRYNKIIELLWSVKGPSRAP